MPGRISLHILLRNRRWYGLVIPVAAFVAELILSSRDITHAAPIQVSPSTWVGYVSYTLLALLFFGVGSLVWTFGYQRQKTIANCLFAFCTLVMLDFGAVPGIQMGDTRLNALGNCFIALAVFFLLYLLMRFPVDLLAGLKRRMLYIVAGTFALLCLLSAGRSAGEVFLDLDIPSWWNLLGLIYFGFAGLFIIGIVLSSMRSTASLRTRQQTRLFFAGTLLAFVPILLLTVIPTLFSLSIGVDGSKSIIFLVFFPIALGYSVLRYNLLVFDVYIRGIVTWIFRIVGLTLLGYLLFTCSSLLLAHSISLLLLGLIGLSVLCAPVISWLAPRLTERFLFPETVYYKNKLKHLALRQGEDTFDLLLAARRLLLDVITTLDIAEAHLFMLDDETQRFMRLSFDEDNQSNTPASVSVHNPTLLAALPLLETSITQNNSFSSVLQRATRPVFWSEVQDADGVGWTRYFMNRTQEQQEADLLLAPLRIGEQIIGLLVLGNRQDRQPIAGADLEVLQHLVDGATPTIETARQYQRIARQQQEVTHKLAQAYDQQKQLSEIKDQLIINVSHELRTPLTEMSGYLDLLASYNVAIDESMRALFIEKAAHGCDELLELVSTILDAAQTGEIASTLPLSVVLLAPLIRDVIAQISPQMSEGHRITQQVPEDIAVLASAQALQRIVRNLLANALKYSPAGTSITVNAETVDTPDEQVHRQHEQQIPEIDKPMVRFTVSDEGPGIPPAELPLLFGKFVRLQRDLSGSIRGTGLGLFISKQLTEQMGGRIWAESSGVVGEGSRFHVMLPSASSSHQTTASVVPLPRERKKPVAYL